MRRPGRRPASWRALALLCAATGACGGTAPARSTGSSLPLDAGPSGPGGDARFSAVAAPRQGAAPGRPVLQPPAVRVLDAGGAPLAGAPVTFTVAGGESVLVGGDAITGADGVARARSWTLGTPGLHLVEASTPSAGPLRVTFSGVSREPGAGFDVTLRIPPGSMTDAQLQAFATAKERIEQVVVGDLPPVTFSRTAAELAGCGGQAVDGEIDDVLVVAEVLAIDGAGQTLGEAGPCFVRSSSGLPVMGHVRLDAADLARLEAAGRLEAVVLHEMLHVLGFGTIWTRAGLLAGGGTADPTFTGPSAREAFLSSGAGSGYAGEVVPVEGGGGAGTAGSHWRESVLGDELMTGWLSGASQPLSRATVASLGDLGYAVDLPSAAEAGSPAPSLRAESGEPVAAAERLDGDVRREPPVAVDDQGRREGR